MHNRGQRGEYADEQAGARMTVGAILGFFDWLSAGLSPEATPLMLTIVAGSTLKGLATVRSHRIADLASATASNGLVWLRPKTR